jgi:hypothetical protein
MGLHVFTLYVGKKIDDMMFFFLGINDFSTFFKHVLCEYKRRGFKLLLEKQCMEKKSHYSDIYVCVRARVYNNGS